jgi:hypothetical protein
MLVINTAGEETRNFVSEELGEIIQYDKILHRNMK